MGEGSGFALPGGEIEGKILKHLPYETLLTKLSFRPFRNCFANMLR